MRTLASSRTAYSHAEYRRPGRCTRLPVLHPTSPATLVLSSSATDATPADVAGCCGPIRYSLSLSFPLIFALASFLDIYRGTQNVVDLPENGEGCFAWEGMLSLR